MSAVFEDSSEHTESSKQIKSLKDKLIIAYPLILQKNFFCSKWNIYFLLIKCIHFFMFQDHFSTFLLFSSNISNFFPINYRIIRVLEFLLFSPNIW